MERFWMILGTQGGVRIENNEKLEFDDHLNENVRFLRTQGLQNEVKIVPKRTEKRKKSRASPEKSAQVCRRVPRERSGAFLRDTASPAVSPGGGGGSPPAGSGFSELTCYFLGFGSISGPDGSETQVSAAIPETGVLWRVRGSIRFLRARLRRPWSDTPLRAART